MIDTVVLTLFSCLTVSTWFSTERSPEFLKSLNTTLVYMKLIVFLYSFFGEPYILVVGIILDLIQASCNLEKEIEQDNKTLRSFLKFLVADMILVFFILYPGQDAVFLNIQITRYLYLFSMLDIEDVTPLIILLFLGLEGINFNIEDRHVGTRLLTIFFGIFTYTWLSAEFINTAKAKYSYTEALLPGSFIKAIIRDEDLVSPDMYEYLMNRTKSFISFLVHGEDGKQKPDPTQPLSPSSPPNVISAIKALQDSIDKYNDDPTRVITWINTTKQLLLFYTQSLLIKEKDEQKRLVYDTFLQQNDPMRKRSNAIHELEVVSGSVEEGSCSGEETKNIFDVIQEERLESHGEEEEETDDDDSSGEEIPTSVGAVAEAILSDDRQIL